MNTLDEIREAVAPKEALVPKRPFLRTDIVYIMDLNLRPFRAREISRFSSDLSKVAGPSEMLHRMDDSFKWLFYEDQLKDFTLFDISSASRNNDANANGAVLRINPRLRVGSYILWRTYLGDPDPKKLKERAGQETSEALSTLFKLLPPLPRCFKENPIERYYPFVAIQVDTDDIDEYAKANAEEIGRILTLDWEQERPTTLRKYVETDLSLRSYEKLLIRWTDALALYARMEDEEKYEKCMFRAVQLFEHCILARVSLRALAGDMETFLRHLAVVTPAKWYRSRDLLATFASAEETFVMYPHVQSVEADRLITAAGDQFGLAKVLASAQTKQSEFRERLEWAKSQTLGLLAVVIYSVDKVIRWGRLEAWVHSGFDHMLRVVTGWL